MPVTAIGVPAPVARRASASFWHAAWYRYRRNRLALVAGVIAVVILLVGLLAPYIAPYSDSSIDLTATWPAPPLTTCWGPTSWAGTP